MSKLLTIYEAKGISIKHYLSRHGMQPDRIQNKKAWYKSPIGRNEIEKTASLMVDLTKNRFTDFGSGVSGDIIDLVCALNRISTPKALEILSDVSSNTALSSFKGNDNKQTDESTQLTIVEIKPITNQNLTNYLDTRNIPVEIAKAHCKEVCYKFKGKEYYAIGFPNDKNGWELRSSVFKGCISPKTVTTIKGATDALNIFEGFSDFLSCLAFHKTTKLKNTSIVLNSIVSYRQVAERIGCYRDVNLFLDNDNSGLELAKKIQNSYPIAKNISQLLYPNHKDFNEFITDKKV